MYKISLRKDNRRGGLGTAKTQISFQPDSSKSLESRTQFKPDPYNTKPGPNKSKLEWVLF